MATPYLTDDTILWADDDPDEIALMRDVLRELGSKYAIVEAHHGKEVLEYLEGAKQRGVFPCLIVLDINMPVLDGKQALAQLKRDPILKDLATVVFTTSDSKLDHQFCEHYCTEMLTKPITFVALKAIIEKLMRICEMGVYK